MIVRVDVDAGRKPLPVGRLVSRLARAGRKVVWMSQRQSPGGKGWHVELKVSPAPRTCQEVVALQCLCGSDLNREAYNLQRAIAVDRKEVPPYWRSRWNVLYGG